MISLILKREPRFAGLILLLLAALGLAGLLNLPRQEDPTLKPRIGLIKTIFPGADTQRVETEVTEIIEEQLQVIPQIDTISSQSRPGISIITIKMADSVDDLSSAWAEVRAEMDEAKSALPSQVPEPVLDILDNRAYALILALVWESDQELQRGLLQRKSDSLESLLYAVRGTQEVKFFGYSPEQYTILLNSEDILARDLDLDLLSRRLAAQEARTNSGEFISGDSRNVFKSDTKFSNIETIRSAPILETPGSSFLTVEAIGEVRRTLVDPLPEMALVGGKPAVMLGVYARSDVRVDLWTADVYKSLEKFTLPEGMVLKVLLEQRETVNTRLSVLLMNLALAVVAVMGVILIIMGPRPSIIVASSIPLTAAFVLAGLVFLGIPIHQMSVTGLIVALGLMIDNAIVVVDELKHELDHGREPNEAMDIVINRLRTPLTSSTITTVLAFFPIALLPGGGGEFVGPIAISVILAVVGSLILSLTLLPPIYLWLNPKARKSESFWTGSKLTSFYRFFFSYPLLAILVSLALPMLGFFSAKTLKEQFFPPTDRSQIRMVLELPSSTPIEVTEAAARAVRETCIAFPEVEDVHWVVGKSVPKFYYNLSEDRQQEPFFAEALVQLKSSRGTINFIPRLQLELDTKYPGYRPRVIQLEQGPPFPAPVEFFLYGPDQKTLRIAGDILRERIARNPRVIGTRATLSDSLADLSLVVDVERTRKVGLEPQSVAETLALITLGRQVGSVFEDTQLMPVVLRMEDAQRADLDKLSSFYLTTPQGRVPLSSLLAFKTVPERAAVAHRHQERVNTVQAFLVAGTLPSTVLQPVLEDLESGAVSLPPGVSYELGGEAAERNTAVGNLAAFAVPLVLLMFSALVVAFRSYRLAFLVGMVAVLSALSGFTVLAVMNIPFGFMAIIGALGLIGIAVNDSTVVLTALQETCPDGEVEKVAQTVAGASRHVVATTLTTIAGFAPLLFGADAFWHPLAGVISGGMLGATVMALFLCPACYLLIRRGKAANSRVDA